MLSLMNKILDQTDHFTCLGMAASLLFGKNKRAIHLHLEHPSFRRLQADPLDLWFKFLDNLSCQVNGPVCVMSDSAVFYVNIQ